MKNKGDSFSLYINYLIDDIPLAECNLDDIEIQFNEFDSKNALNYKLSEGNILLDENLNLYYIRLEQDDTFVLPGITKYQIRFYLAGDVISTDVKIFRLGEVLSNEVLS